LELEQVEAIARHLDLLANSITSFTRNHLEPAQRPRLFVCYLFAVRACEATERSAEVPRKLCADFMGPTPSQIPWEFDGSDRFAQRGCQGITFMSTAKAVNRLFVATKA
jgi:hypothetical protein